MMIEARRAYRGVSGALLALTLVLLATVPVAQADTIYPDNVLQGTEFTAGLNGAGGSGWTAVSNHCTLLIGLIPSEEPVTCNADTTHDAGIGTPPGSMRQSYEPAADGLSPLLFNATTVAVSSPFTIGPNAVGATGKTTFQFDRRADVQAILNGDSRVTYTWTLVDETGGNARSELFREALNDNDNVFQGQLNDQMPNVIPGRTYHLEISSLFDTAILSVALQKTIENFDNIRLRVQDGTATFGAPSAITDPATDITATSATLNGRTNARGIASTYTFAYGTDPALAGATTIGPFPGGNLTTFQARARPITGLTACTTYYFRIAVSSAQGSDTGSIRSFGTACKPDAITLAVMTSPDAATFSSSINPRSLDTTYYYEYGLASDGFPNRIPLATDPQLMIPAGSRAVAPNSYPVGGLTKQTAYHVRVVAFNSAGSTTGNVVNFTTPGTGDTGQNGTNGTDGTNGTNGTDGAPGAQGPAGATGAIGPAGRNGTNGKDGKTQSICGTEKVSCKNPMIRIDATTIRVPMRGRLKGVVRVRVFCKALAVETCSGQMKIRSRSKIQPQGFGFPARPVRKVTFATAPLQLDERKIGFAIFSFNTQRLSVLRRLRSVAAEVTVTVIDADNNRQRVKRDVTLRAG